MGLKFDESLLTGIQDIDIQHKLFFDAINGLEGLEEKQNADDLWFVVSNIEEYARSHFQTEEEYMRKFMYPDTDEHLDQHREFLGKYKKLKKDFEEKGITIDYMEILKVFLEEWIIQHYSCIDQKMAIYIRNYMED